jgi:hypothetical protein
MAGSARKRKRHRPEEIVAKLRQVDEQVAAVLIWAGSNVNTACNPYEPLLIPVGGAGADGRRFTERRLPLGRPSGASVDRVIRRLSTSSLCDTVNCRMPHPPIPVCLQPVGSPPLAR